MHARTAPFSEALSFFTQRQAGSINRAYQSVLERLGPKAQGLDRRTTLATCVLDLAKAGETDEDALRAQAFAKLGLADGAGRRFG